MQITVVDRKNQLAPEAREIGERRLLFALSRFSSRIQRVSMVIDDVNGPRGGVDKTCQVTVHLHRIGDIHVSCDHEDLRTCVAQAADRAGRAVARAVDKAQGSLRRSIQTH